MYGRAGDVDDERVIRKGRSEETRANDVNGMTQRRTKAAPDKNQDIVHLSFSRIGRISPACNAGFAARSRSPQDQGTAHQTKGRQLNAAAPELVRIRSCKVRPSRTAGRHTPSSPGDRSTPSHSPDGDCDNRCNRSAHKNASDATSQQR